MMLDDADRALLDLLQRDARATIELLASVANLSPASVQRRLRALRASGVIRAEVAVVDPAKLGGTMTFIVMVEMERERPDQIDDFARRMNADPEVQQCYYVTGEADFCLICTAADMESFDALTRRLFFDNANVRRFRTSVVMSVRKQTLAVPTIEQ